MSDNEDDAAEDKTSDLPTGNLKCGTITAVFDVDPYLACPTPSCHNTKLTPEESCSGGKIMKCKNCGKNYSPNACNNYLRATVMIEEDESNKPPQKVAIFRPLIEKLFNARGFTLPSTNDQTQLLVKFFDIIPVEVKFQMINNTIKQLVCKRVA